MTLSSFIVATTILLSPLGGDQVTWRGEDDDDPTGIWEDHDHWWGNVPTIDDWVFFDTDTPANAIISEDTELRGLSFIRPATITAGGAGVPTISTPRLVVDTFARLEGVHLSAPTELLIVDENALVHVFDDALLELQELIVGTGVGDGTVFVHDATLSVDGLIGDKVRIGSTEANGTVTFNGGATGFFDVDLIVNLNEDGYGELNVLEGSTLEVHAPAFVGRSNVDARPAAALLRVDGEGSVLSMTATTDLEVGGDEPGPEALLDVTNAASLITAENVSVLIDVAGRMNADDATIEIGKDLIVRGLVDVDFGSTLSARRIDVDGGTFEAEGTIDIRDRLIGTAATIDFGIADVTIRDADIDADSTVDVGASTLRFVGDEISTVDTLLDVSSSSAAVPHVYVEDGHRMNSGGWVLGWNANETGRLTIGPTDGSGQPEVDTGSGGGLTIGFDGTGEAVVQGGGLLSTDTLAIGLDWNGDGSLLVTGVQDGFRSSLILQESTSSSLWVGTDGDATVEIAGGAQAIVNGDVKIADGGGSGEMTVGGSQAGHDAYVLVRDNLWIGGNESNNGGPGTVRITDGGTVEVEDTTRLYLGDTLLIEPGGRLTASTLHDTDGGDVVIEGRLEFEHYLGTLENADGGIVTPALIADGATAGAFVQTNGTLEIAINGAEDDEFGRVTTTGGIIVGGTLDVDVDLGVDLDGETLVILDGVSVLGEFATVNGPENMTVAYVDGQVRLVFNDAVCPGDIDGNGVVDVSDLITLLAAWGPCSDCDEDFTGDGVVDVNELIALLANWGTCM